MSPPAAAPGPISVPNSTSGIVCSACGENVDAAPEATSVRPHGAYAIVAEWRICACGAFVRSERVKRFGLDDGLRSASK